MRILLIEDDRTVRQYISFLAQCAVPGSDVQEIDNLKDAIQCVKDWYYDLVILDLLLPDSNDPLDTMVRLLPETRGVVDVLVVTGYDSVDQAEIAKKLGASEYIVKMNLNEHTLRVFIEGLMAKRSVRESDRAAKEVAVVAKEMRQTVDKATEELRR